MHTVQLSNDECKLSFLNYGARIIDWQVNLGSAWRPIVLHYPKLDDYINDRFYLGAICGPYANRIANGVVDTQCSKMFKFSCNDGVHHLHGGFNGLHKHYWDVFEQTANSVTFVYLHPDGTDGYAGPMSFKACYTLIEKSLTLTLTCQSKSLSIIGPTGHAYFNLNGVNTALSGLAQYLQSDAEWLTPLNNQGLPVGSELQVSDSELNFQQARLLTSGSQLDKLDNNFVFSENKNRSILIDAEDQLCLSVSSDYPAVQLYSGRFLDQPFKSNQAVCIEPHYGADAPNRVNRFDYLIKPGEVWRKTINYQLRLLK